MSELYKRSMLSLGKYVPQKLQPLWNHPAGPQTIFFWAPAFKWGLVIAGLGDLQRPANQLSVSQSSALAVTGIIWTKYSLAITPKNWSLFSVNLFVAITSLYQISRAINYKRQQGGLAKATTTEGK
ncbi:uncharacterized protein LOC116428010 isoform X1 [Nomia melanderi]|uniref:uncharacterized protein LOC116428010 isoform X1 n=1 Tax=Nomia melanderi TaxID=2448451 RepID=UPI0013041388|nr:mitochondrial pyruvate carrier 3-like isoform X1 [Nomia melanderi]